MAAYCTPQDLGRFGVNRKALEDIPSNDAIVTVIASTSRAMDEYLGKQFQLPLQLIDPTHPEFLYGDSLREKCAIISAYRVLSVRGFKPGENPEDSMLRLNYEDAMKWLGLVAACKITPLVVPSPTPDAGFASPAAPAVISSDPRWLDLGGNLPFGGGRR